jgi:hypothetical protein
MNILSLIVSATNLAISFKTAAFMVDMANTMEKRFRYLRDQLRDLEEDEPQPLSNTKLQSGLIDLDVAQTYDPRFDQS